MVRALKELPSLVIIEVALPKIYGFEVCKKLKSRPETKHIGVVLVPSIYDKTKYRRDPVSLYGADDYIEEHEISTKLMASIERIKSKTTQPAPEKPHPQPTTAAPATPEIRPVEKEVKSASAPEPAAAAAQEPSAEDVTDEFTEKAKRLARTIISDIYLYNSAKVDNAVRHGNFYAVFASEVREGLKLYENRIPKETRAKADFFREAIDNFLSAKKKTLS
jgi:response regulator RpfG family c-di-GMP phosphodiesterase